MDTIELQGQIHKIYNGKRNTIVTLFVSGAKNNFPQIIFMVNERTKISSFTEGDYVHILGCLKTRGIKNPNGTQSHCQFIRGMEISKVNVVNCDELYREEEEKGETEYINSVLLNGEIISSTKGHNLVNIVVRPDGERFNVNITKYTNEPDKVLTQCQAGYRISVQCEIQTVRKIIRGEMKFFENIVIKQLNTRMLSIDE